MGIDFILTAFADGLSHIDASKIPHKNFRPGVGPYGEPQLLKELVSFIQGNYSDEFPGIRTQRTPDVLVPNKWAIEAKVVRPFGDNGVIAEHWSQNLLHPYEGNTSLIGDIYKLINLPGPERRAVIAITFSHKTPLVDLLVIIKAFEVITRDVLNLPLGIRYEKSVDNLIHPVHQASVIYGWEVGASHP